MPSLRLNSPKGNKAIVPSHTQEGVGVVGVPLGRSQLLGTILEGSASLSTRLAAVPQSLSPLLTLTLTLLLTLTHRPDAMRQRRPSRSLELLYCVQLSAKRQGFPGRRQAFWLSSPHWATEGLLCGIIKDIESDPTVSTRHF